MNVFRPTPWVPALREPLEARAEHEQEQQRLHERGDHPQPVGAEADQLAAPDDPDRAQLGGEAALRDADADDRVRGGAPVDLPVAAAPVVARPVGSRAHRLPPVHHLHHHAVAELGLVLLGVADRRARCRT